MLIISRKSGESFLIGDSIEVFILDSKNDKAKIGINAPQDVKIIRKELKETEKINQESSVTAENMNMDELKKILMGKN